jgi:hypothetical protein
MSKGGLQLALDLVHESSDAARQETGGNKDAHLRDRHGECRDGDDAEKHLGPDAHACSSDRAC